MNWVGGARRRLIKKSEKKIQKQYFEEKRQKRKACKIQEESESNKKTRSQDLLCFQAVVKAHDTKKEFAETDPPPPRLKIATRSVSSMRELTPSNFVCHTSFQTRRVKEFDLVKRQEKKKINPVTLAELRTVDKLNTALNISPIHECSPPVSVQKEPMQQTETDRDITQVKCSKTEGKKRTSFLKLFHN